MTNQVTVQHEGHFRTVEAFVDDPNKMVLKAGLIGLCKRIAAVLERQYPGWLWAIRPDEAGGIIDIFSVRIDGKWGYTLHTDPLHEDENLRAVTEAGGEILERYGFPRGAYSYDVWKAGNWRFGTLVPLLTDKERGMQRAMHAQMVRQGIATGQIGLIVEHGSNHLGAALKAAGRK